LSLFFYPFCKPPLSAVGEERVGKRSNAGVSLLPSCKSRLFYLFKKPSGKFIGDKFTGHFAAIINQRGLNGFGGFIEILSICA